MLYHYNSTLKALPRHLAYVCTWICLVPVKAWGIGRCAGEIKLTNM